MMNPEDLPTKGRRYGSGGIVTELNAIIDQELEYRPERCDCDSNSRCWRCIMEQEFRYKKEVIKKRILDYLRLKGIETK